MIPRMCCRLGEKVTFRGTAADFDHAIRAIEFSLDEGRNWTRYETPGTNDYQNVSWEFTYEPERSGLHMLHVRSVNDEGAASPEADSVELLVEQGDRWKRV